MFFLCVSVDERPHKGRIPLCWDPVNLDFVVPFFPELFPVFFQENICHGVEDYLRELELIFNLGFLLWGVFIETNLDYTV